MEAISKFFMKMAVKKKMGDMGLDGGNKDGGILGGGGGKNDQKKKKNPDVLHEGVLLKKSKWKGRWDKRYFVLEKVQFKYWEGVAQGSGAPKGSFRINVHTNCSGDPTDKNTFTLQLNDEDYRLRAETPKECAQWVQVIQQLIMKLRRDDKKSGNRMALKAKHDAIRAKYGLDKPKNIESQKK